MEKKMTDFTKRCVLDINHNDEITSFTDLKNDGIIGIIHKANQGTYVDPLYTKRKTQALAAGLLWGSYSFNTADDVETQVNTFISATDPDENTLMALDFETNTKSDMTIQQAVEFMKLLESKIGREAVIYGGDKIKENIDSLSSDDQAYLTSRRLWLCEYGNNAILPKGWKSYWLWQYAADGTGPQPHTVNGATGNMDLNVYNGSLDQLKSEWAGKTLNSSNQNNIATSTVTQNSNTASSDISPDLQLADTSGNMFTPIVNDIKKYL